MEKLRQLIQESISEYIKAIDEAGHRAGMEARKSATEEAIAKRKTMVTFEGLDEDMKQMVDERKVKEVNSEIKALEKSLVKLQKQFDKLNSKTNKSEKVEDTEEKEIVDELSLNENEEEFDLESYFQKANKEYGWDFDMNTKIEGDLEYGDESWERKFAQKLMNIDELPYNKWKVAANRAYNTSQVNESDDMNIYEILHMQKLAGIISESEYKAKIEEVKKKKASAGMTKKEKSSVVKKARAGKDIGKKGKGFEDVAKSAGGGKKGEKIAAAAMWKGEAKKAKSLKEEVLALFEGEGNEGTIDFGSFKNVEWYSRENNKIFLVVTESDNFRKIENSMALNPNADTYTDKERSFLNNKLDELANDMSDYLMSVGVENEVFDSPMGYGQEIDNLVIEFNADDLDKIK